MESLKFLKSEHIRLQSKLLAIESDLKKSLDNDLDENALQEQDREILNQLFQIEKDNLKRVDEAIYNMNLIE